TIGQGASAVYIVRVTNTGSQTETFNLNAFGLPAGFGVEFSQQIVTAPPGASNFREVRLTITAPVGSTIGTHPFAVIATLQGNPAIHHATPGTLYLSALGIDIEFAGNVRTPQSTLQLVITNTGTTSETF